VFFLCVYFFFLCGLTHRKISFNLGERNFSVRVTPTEKLFLTAKTQNNWIFLSLYFCGYFSEGTPLEKHFSDGIRIFLYVFAPTEKSEIAVVIVYPITWRALAWALGDHAAAWKVAQLLQINKYYY